MGCLSFICSTKFILTLLLLSAIPIGIIITLERAPAAGHVYSYHSVGWFRETAKWDDLNRRFLVSGLEGSVGEIKVPDDHQDGHVLTETIAFKDEDLAGNLSVGITIDRPRNRLLVVKSDLIGNRYSGLAAYDLSSWQRLFIAHLAGHGDEKSFADDVAVDAEGNAYVTDVKGGKVWKVSEDGKLSSIIKSPLFTPKEWYKNIVALSGIAYHPDGFLLVIHTFTGNLYKIDLKKGHEDIQLVDIVSGSLKNGDGMDFLSTTKLVVVGNPSSKVVESVDGWNTASVTGSFSGPMHRLATGVTVKDEKAYLNYLIGMGYPRKKHVIVEAIFSA